MSCRFTGARTDLGTGVVSTAGKKHWRGYVRKRIDPEVKKAAIEYYKQHGSAATAKKFGVARNTITSWGSQAGVKRCHRGINSKITDEEWEPYLHVFYEYETYEEMAKHTPWTDTTIRRKAIKMGLESWKAVNSYCAAPPVVNRLFKAWGRDDSLRNHINNIKKWRYVRRICFG